MNFKKAIGGLALLATATFNAVAANAAIPLDQYNAQPEEVRANIVAAVLGGYAQAYNSAGKSDVAQCIVQKSQEEDAIGQRPFLWAIYDELADATQKAEQDSVENIIGRVVASTCEYVASTDPATPKAPG